jgi:fucose permease
MDNVTERPAGKAIPLKTFSLTAAVSGMVMITLGPLLDAILRDFGAGRAQGGVLSLAFYGGTCLSIIFINFIIGPLPSKATLAIGAALQGFGLFLAGWLSGSLPMLAAVFSLAGFGYGILLIYPGMFVTSIAQPSPQRPLSILNGFFAIGVLVTPLAIGRALTMGCSWRLVFMAEAAISAALLIAYLSAPVANIPGRKNLGMAEAAGIWKFNPGLLLLIVLSLWLYVGAENMFNVWLAKFHIDIFESDAARAGQTVSLFWLGLTAGRFGVLRLIARVSPGRMLFSAGTVMTASIVLVALSPGRVTSELFCLVTGVGASVLFPLIAGYAGRFPDWFAGVVFSFGYLASAAGGMLFPYLVGPAADAWGFRTAMLLAAVPAAAVVMLSIPLDRSARR